MKGTVNTSPSWRTAAYIVSFGTGLPILKCTYTGIYLFFGFRHYAQGYVVWWFSEIICPSLGIPESHSRGL